MKRGIGDSELMVIRAVLTAVIRALPAAKELLDVALSANNHVGLSDIQNLIPKNWSLYIQFPETSNRQQHQTRRYAMSHAALK